MECKSTDTDIFCFAFIVSIFFCAQVDIPGISSNKWFRISVFGKQN